MLPYVNPAAGSRFCTGLLSILLLLFLQNPAFSTLQEHGNEPASSEDSISLSQLKYHLNVLAQDSLKGRGTAQEGARLASRYLVDFYSRDTFSGLEGFELHRQTFTLESKMWEDVKYSLYINEDPDTPAVYQSRIAESVSSNNEPGLFFPLHGGSENVKSPVVFAGFGPGDHSYRIADDSDAGFRDKWVLMFEPSGSGLKRNDSDEFMSRSDMVSKMVNRHGAAGVMFISEKSIEKWEVLYETMKQQLPRPLAIRKPEQRFRHAERPAGTAVSVHPGVAKDILGLDNRQQLDSLRAYWKEPETTAEAEMTGHIFRNHPEINRREIEEENIIAVLPGHDEDASDDAVIISAHYDHLGLGEPDDRNDIVYSGADDNASGTAVIMELARTLAASSHAGNPHDRTLIFLHAAAEEWGLFGARYYAENPIYDLDNTITSINVDMVGAVDERHAGNPDEPYVYVIGGGMVSRELQRMLEETNQSGDQQQIKLDEHYNDPSHPKMLYRRSDQWAFGERGIPFVFFFSGLHDHYHRPSDTAERISWTQLNERAGFIYEFVRNMAQDGDIPRMKNERPDIPSMRSR